MATVMKINNYEVTEAELMKEWTLVKNKYLEGGTILDNKIEQITLKYTKQNIITRKLLQGLSEELNEEIDYKEIQTEYHKLIEYFGGKENLLKKFSSEKTSEFKIKSNIEKSIQIDRILSRWKQEGSALLSEEEIINHYENNKNNYSVPDGIVTSHFMLKLNKSTKDELTFKNSYEKLLKTKNISNFYNQVKSLPGFTAKDKVLIEVGYLEKKIEKELFSLADNDFTKLIKSNEGIHFFTKIKFVESKILAYEDVHNQVKKELVKIKQNNYIKQKINQLKAKANIQDFF